MSNPFALIDAINTKKDVDEEELKQYKSFLINRSFSYHPDAIFEANEMNRYSFLPNDRQYSFYKYSLPSRKRFAKWAKPEESEHLEMVMEYFMCNRKVAEEYLSILSDEDISVMYERCNKGGLNNDTRRNPRKSGVGKAKKTR